MVRNKGSTSKVSEPVPGRTRALHQFTGGDLSPVNSFHGGRSKTDPGHGGLGPNLALSAGNQIESEVQEGTVERVEEETVSPVERGGESESDTRDIPGWSRERGRGWRQPPSSAESKASCYPKGKRNPCIAGGYGGTKGAAEAARHN